LNGFTIFALPYQLDVSLHVNPSRASGAAGSSVLFIDSEGNGNRLGEETVDGFAVTKIFIELIRDGYGTSVCALSASRTSIFKDVAGFAPDLCRKIADKSAHLRYFAVR
jgi:hypothetical protein